MHSSYTRAFKTPCERLGVDVLGRMMWHLTKKNGGDNINMMDIIMSIIRDS